MPRGFDVLSAILKKEMRTEKILLICDNASFHKAKWLTEWVETNSNWLQLRFLRIYFKSQGKNETSKIYLTKYYKRTTLCTL